MSEDKKHNIAGWRSRLEQLEGLPGEWVPDKSRTWEKLYARLDKKSKRKKPVWRWMAAACLFGLAIVVGLASRKQAVSLVKDGTHEQKPAVLPAIPAFLEENKHAYTSSPDQYKKPKQAGKAVKGNEIQARYMKTEPIITTMINRKKEQTLTVLPDTVEQRPVATVLPGTKPSSPLKKLRVVHINELDDGREEGFMADNQNESHFTIKLTGSDSAGSRLLADRQPANAKLKIKLSPQN